MIEEKRRRYFDEADRLRALGESVEEVFPDVEKDTKSEPASLSARAYLTIRGTTSISEFKHRNDLGGDA